VNQEILIALACYTLLLEVKAGTERLEDGYLVDFSWLSMLQIAVLPMKS
jgi:hypothetical protein